MANECSGAKMELKQLSTKSWDERHLPRFIATPSIGATKKWLKQANEQEKEAFFNMMSQADGEPLPNEQNAISTSLRPEVLPNVKNWMENANNEEREAVMKLFRALSRNPSSKKQIPLQNGTANLSFSNGTQIGPTSVHKTPPIKNTSKVGRSNTMKYEAMSRSKYSSSGKMESYSDQNGGFHWRFKLPPVLPNTNGTFIHKSNVSKPMFNNESRQSILGRQRPENMSTHAPFVRPIRAEFDIAPDWRMNRKIALKELRKSFEHTDKEGAIVNNY